MNNRWWLGIFMLLACVGAVVLPALTLVAYTPDHTYTVSPESLRIEAEVGTDASASFSVSPGQGDFTEYPVSYRVSFSQSYEDYCLEWDTNGMQCIGGYDYETWTNNGLLCEYLTLDTETDSFTQSGTLQVPGDPEDTIPVTLSVPCVGTECSVQDSWPPPFPAVLLNHELTCGITVGEKLQVSLLTPYTAYAQSAGSVVRVTGVVRAVQSGVGTLTLPTEGRYEGVRGVDSTGPISNRGTANEDMFTFKVVYTHPSNAPPDDVSLWVDNTMRPMSIDTASVNPLLYDGDYRNGEQYVATSTYPTGTHAYWFTADPDLLLSGTSSVGEAFIFTAGHSNVAFIPGIQASRLFKQGTLFEDQLWEPNNDGDARALAMRDDGTSLGADLYTKPGAEGVIDEIFSFTENVYKSFLDDLDSWKYDEGLIADYAVLPYDWRLAFSAVLSGGRVDGTTLHYDPSYATDTPYLYQELERLAASSDTGRITIVAHSMGGLLTKKLLADLEDNPQHPYRDLLGKVDTVVLVASPQLGTPKAVSSLLHGYGQELDIPGIGWPNFAKAVTLREVAKNMPSVYTLLPSPTYFDRVRDVAEDSTILPYTAVAKGNILHDVTTYDTMREHLTNSPYPESEDLTKQLALPLQFVDDAHALHTRIDTWMPPEVNDDGVPDMRVVQIAGWGVTETLKGIEYVQAQRITDCPSGMTGTCYENFIDPQPIWTTDGDGTVVLPSAVAMGATTDGEKGIDTWYVDMYNYNKDAFVGRSHATIFETNPVRTVIKDTIHHSIIQESDVPYLYADQSRLVASEPYLRIALHSPVTMDVYDTLGNHVGVSTTSVNGQFSVDAQVPNSYYTEFGEGKYLGVPLNGAYTLMLAGTATGTAMLELTEEQIGRVTHSQIFTDIPVTPRMKATVSVGAVNSVTALTLDTNGDGMQDTVTYSDAYQKTVSFGMLRQAITSLRSKSAPLLLVQVRAVELLVAKGKTRLALIALRALEQEIVFLRDRKRPSNIRISNEEAMRLLAIIDVLIKDMQN